MVWKPSRWKNLIDHLWTLYLIVLWWNYLKQQILPLWTAAEWISVWTCQAFYGPSEYMNLTLRLLLLTITYANRMFNIFLIQLLSFMTIHLMKSLVSLFCMIWSVYCLFVRLWLIFWLPEMVNKDEYISRKRSKIELVYRWQLIITLNGLSIATKVADLEWPWTSIHCYVVSLMHVVAIK